MTRPLRSTDPSRIGDYELIGRIGGGGMGEVFLGRSPGGRLAAVKVVRDLLADDPRFRERFRREVDAARSVSGAYTAAVLDADPEAERPWLATAYIDGPTLLDRVAEDGPLSAPETRRLGAGLAEALRDIHRAGLVHRDLKPGNVLLAADGPRLIDFGIIRVEDGEGLTETGYVLGSAGFMAPEQAAEGEATAAADVYSLGAVLTFAATGHGPFGSGPTPGVLLRQASGDRDISGVPEGLRDVVARCLDILPGARPSTEALLELLGGSPIEDTEIAGTPTAIMRAEPGKGSKKAKSAKSPTSAKTPKSSKNINSPQSAKTTHGTTYGAGGRRVAPKSEPMPTRRKALLLGMAGAGVAAFVWGVADMPHGDGKTTGAEKAGDTTSGGTSTDTGLPGTRTKGVLGGPAKSPDWSGKLASKADLIALSETTVVVQGENLTGLSVVSGHQLWNVPGGTYTEFTDGDLPVSGDTIIQAGYGTGDMVGVRVADGAEVWRVPAPAKWLPSGLVGASPDLAIGWSFTDAGSSTNSDAQGLWAVDTHLHQQVWEAPIDSTMDGSPYYSDGTGLILISQPHNYQLTAYDAKTGRHAWTAPDTSPRTSTPALSTAVSSHGTTIYWATNRLYAFDAHGQLAWPMGVTESEDGEFHAVIADDTTVYAAADESGGTNVVAAYKASDGAPIWRAVWPDNVSFFSAALEAKLALGGGILYVADHVNSTLIAVNATNGETLWQFHDPDASRDDPWQIVANDQRVFVCYGTTVHGFVASSE